MAAADGSKLNWDDLTTDGTVTGFTGLVNTLDLKVSGSLDINIAGFVLAAGTFEITQQSGLTINDGVNPVITQRLPADHQPERRLPLCGGRRRLHAGCEPDRHRS